MPTDDETIDEDLTKGLRQARSKPRHFALIARGRNCLKLFVSKKTLRQSDLIKAKVEYKAKKIYRGICFGAQGLEMVFEFEDKDPTVGESQLKRFITEHAGMPLKPRFESVRGDR